MLKISSKDYAAVIVFLLETERRKQGLSQNDLAFKTHFSRSDISHLESGRKELKIYEMITLCNALKVDFSHIIQQANDKIVSFTK